MTVNYFSVTQFAGKQLLHQVEMKNLLVEINNKRTTQTSEKDLIRLSQTVLKTYWMQLRNPFSISLPLKFLY